MFENWIRHILPQYKSRRELKQEIVQLQRENFALKINNGFVAGMLDSYRTKKINKVQARVFLSGYEQRKLVEGGFGFEGYVREKVFEELKNELIDHIELKCDEMFHEEGRAYTGVIYIAGVSEEKTDEQSVPDRQSDARS
ncbi:MAG: hypothetical protein IKK34_08190 [Clostridia bacterium]|nr:hypothetical protein [Clostridia bacterium]